MSYENVLGGSRVITLGKIQADRHGIANRPIF
jgi:hypothetical protein